MLTMANGQQVPPAINSNVHPVEPQTAFTEFNKLAGARRGL